MAEPHPQCVNGFFLDGGTSVGVGWAMKVLQRKVLKALPGRMPDVMEIAGQQIQLACRTCGASGGWSYMPLAEGAADLRTLVIEIEWDSVETQEEGHVVLKKDPEMLALEQRLARLVESSRGELYTPFNLP